MANMENPSEEFATEADKRLWQLIRGDNPRVDEVRAAIAAGANVNSTDHAGRSVLMAALATWPDVACLIPLMGGEPASDTAGSEKGPDGRWAAVRLLIDNGANVNYEDADGLCPLSEAFHHHNPTVIEYLLSRGANPNVILCRDETILDHAEDFLSMHKWAYGEDSEEEFDKRIYEADPIIIDLLKSFGAKSIGDVVAAEPRRWLVVFAAYETGLLTHDGYLEVANIPEVSESFCQDFEEWLSRYFDTWPDKSFDTKPADFDRAAHNAEGQRLAEEIKRMVGQAIEVEYLYLSAEWEEKKIRNVVRKLIG